MQFCTKSLKWEDEKWKTVLWSDEATFNVTENQGGKVRLEPDTNIFHPKYTQRKGKYYGSVMVWGVLGHYGHGKLVVLPNTKNAIWNCCFTIWRIVFMQTRMMCSCRIMLLHITKLIKEWFLSLPEWTT